MIVTMGTRCLWLEPSSHEDGRDISSQLSLKEYHANTYANKASRHPAPPV